MGNFSDLVQKAAHRLRADPAVYGDVCRELEAHLEDAADEARAAGATGDEAEQKALKAFGDPEALADQLYLANRRRLRMGWASRHVNRVGCCIFILWGLFAIVAVLGGQGILPQSTGTTVALVVLLASVAVLNVVWFVLWIRADRKAKISTSSLLLAWFWGSFLADVAASSLGIAHGEWRIYGHQVQFINWFSLALFVALAVLQQWLRRRWKVDGRGNGKNDAAP